MSSGGVHYRYIGAFVDELARSGVRNVCFAPGSRSTPLAVMLAGHPDIALWTHLDERSAGFFALGMAKASQQPVGLLCSSGTATANFYPAVIEARYSRVPLVVMTADRPPELQDVGAPQTIDQNMLYGQHPKWATTVALPEDSPEMLRYARALGGRATSTATSTPAGPVHLNFPFREPLMPVKPEGLPDHNAGDAPPLFSASQAPRPAAQATIDRLRDVVTTSPRGLIVCGPDDAQHAAADISRLGATLGYPILADPLSGVRCGPHHDDLIIDAYDAFLRDEAITQSLAPELIIRFGAMPTSKPYLLYSERQAQAWQVLVDAGGGWNDPALQSNDVVHADPALFCQQLIEAVGNTSSVTASTWAGNWTAINRATRRSLCESGTHVETELFEGRIFQELAPLLPPGATLFAGNSMPVRDLDTFFPGTSADIRFLSNRGANGIDGVISSALGANTTTDGPLVLVIGDLSFYHDMNGLLAAKQYDLNATIILVNNDGGGIFSFLPQAEHPEQFETLFGTPHGLDFQPAAALYDIEFARVTDWAGFREAVAGSLASSGTQIIETPVADRPRNVALHRERWEAMRQSLNELTLQCQVTT